MKRKALLICGLLAIASLASCGGGAGDSSSEVSTTNFPTQEIQDFFDVTDLPPVFSGSTFYTEESTSEDNRCYVVYTEKNSGASNEYFVTYLITQGYSVEYDEVNSYYTASSKTKPFMLVFYENEVEGTTYFTVQYYYVGSSSVNPGTSENPGGSEDSDYVLSSSFPQEIIKNYLGASEDCPSYVASEYYYLRTVDDMGYDVVMLYSTISSTASVSAYTQTLNGLGYTIDEYEDEVGPYYDAYSETYEILFWEDDYDNSFNLQIYYLGSIGGDVGGDEEYEYEELTQFPSSRISSYLGVSEALPSYSASTYYYLEVDFYGMFNYVDIYSAISSTACNSSYRTTLINAGYEVQFYEDAEYGDYYAALKDGAYYVCFYEEDGYFYLEVLNGEGYTLDDDTGGDSGSGDIQDEYVEVTSFPSEQMKSFFKASQALVSYSASDYTYIATTDEDGYLMFYIYSTKSSTACNSAYYTILSNAGYTIEEMEDEYGPYYYAYNDNTGYELFFYEDDDYGTFDVQIYYYGDVSDDNTGSGNGENVDVGDGIVITQDNFPTSYGPHQFTVNGVTFESDRIMVSTQYKGTFQLSAPAKGAGTLYNKTPISGATTLIVDLNYSYNFDFDVFVGNSASSCTTEVNPSVNGNIYTYNISGYSYIKIVNAGNAAYINSITIA